MKKIITIAFMALISGIFGQGMSVPNSIVVNEGKYSQEGVERNGFDVILQGSEKAVNDAWGKFLDAKYAFKVKSKGTTTSGEELMNTNWSDKQFAIQSGAIKDASGTHMRLWVFFGADILVNSTDYAKEAANVKSILKEFAKAYYVGVFNEELADQTKVVSSQGKEVTGLAEDRAKIEKAIAKEESAILKAEKKKQKCLETIQKNQSKIVSLDGEVQNSKQKIVEKKSKIDKTSSELDKASGKFEDVEAAQKRIKEKISAVEKL